MFVGREPDRGAESNLPGAPKATLQDLVGTFESGTPIAAGASEYGSNTRLREKLFTWETHVWQPSSVVVVDGADLETAAALPASLVSTKLWIPRIDRELVLYVAAIDESSHTTKILRADDTLGRAWTVVAETEEYEMDDGPTIYGQRMFVSANGLMVELASAERQWTLNLDTGSVRTTALNEPIPMSHFRAPYEPSELVVGTGPTSVRTRVGVESIKHSRDDGDTWHTVFDEGHIDRLQVAGDFEETSIAAVQVWRNSVWITRDHGATWAQSGPRREIWSLAVSDDGELVAFIQRGRPVGRAP